MKAKEARDLGKRIAALVSANQTDEAHALLAPLLAERTPFRFLGHIGESAGAVPLDTVNTFLERLASERIEGGWVVIGKALGQQLERDRAGAFTRCRGFIIAADVWYGADILGERVPGPALVSDFAPSLGLLAPWREGANHWVRRAVGVAVHFWTKRSRGAAEHAAGAKKLLEFLEPMFEDRETAAVKGVGWGLKTLGRNYPELLTEWLAVQVAGRQRPHRTLLLRKAMTYLTDEQRARAAESGAR